MASHHTQRLQILPSEQAKLGNVLGSGSEVDRFRVELRRWPFVVTLAVDAALGGAIALGSPRSGLPSRCNS